MENTYSVPDVSCGHCKSAIESALQPLEGVQRAAVDIDSRSVAVTYDDASVTDEQIRAAIESAGYPVA